MGYRIATIPVACLRATGGTSICRWRRQNLGEKRPDILEMCCEFTRFVDLVQKNKEPKTKKILKLVTRWTQHDSEHTLGDKHSGPLSLSSHLFTGHYDRPPPGPDHHLTEEADRNVVECLTVSDSL